MVSVLGRDGMALEWWDAFWWVLFDLFFLKQQGKWVLPGWCCSWWAPKLEGSGGISCFGAQSLMCILGRTWKSPGKESPYLSPWKTAECQWILGLYRGSYTSSCLGWSFGSHEIPLTWVAPSVVSVFLGNLKFKGDATSTLKDGTGTVKYLAS